MRDYFSPSLKWVMSTLIKFWSLRKIMSKSVISAYIEKTSKNKFSTPDSVQNLSDEWKQLIS